MAVDRPGRAPTLMTRRWDQRWGGSGRAVGRDDDHQGRSALVAAGPAATAAGRAGNSGGRQDGARPAHVPVRQAAAQPARLRGSGALLAVVVRRVHELLVTLVGQGLCDLRVHDGGSSYLRDLRFSASDQYDIS